MNSPWFIIPIVFSIGFQMANALDDMRDKNAAYVCHSPQPDKNGFTVQHDGKTYQCTPRGRW